MTSARGRFIGFGLTDSRGSHTLPRSSRGRLCLPQRCPAISGSLSLPSRDPVDQGHPPLWGSATRHASVAAPRRFNLCDCEPPRPARSRSPVPLESSPFDGLIIAPSGGSVKRSSKLFFKVSALCFSGELPPPGLRPLDPLSAVGVPRESWGLSPSRKIILPHSGSDVNPFLKKIFTFML